MTVPAGYEPTAMSIGRAAFNKDTRALLVDAQNITLSADSVTIDETAIVEGIAGTTGKTITDLTTVLGTTSDAPIGDNTTPASASAETSVSLWKRIVNVLIAILAKLPTTGTAGTPATAVLTVQGAAAGYALPVNGSGVTQPVSGTVTVAQSTAANLKIDLSETGANTTALKVDASATTQPVSGTITANLGTTDTASLTAMASVLQSTAQISSGTSAKSTTSDAAVTVIAADASHDYHFCRIFNAGAVTGFYSRDGGTTWNYLPANSSLFDSFVFVHNTAIQVKRIAGGSDLTGIYAEMW